MFLLGFLAGVYTVGGAAILFTFVSDWPGMVAATRETAARFRVPTAVYLAAAFVASPALLIRSVMR